MTDVTVQLPSGGTARIRNFVVFRGNSGSTLTIVIQAAKPASGDPRAVSEALELANLHNEFAQRAGVDQIAVSICETEECIKATARAAMIMFFRRGPDQSWHPDRTVEFP